MAAPYHRDVGPVLQVLRSFLRGRSWNEQLRKPKDLSPRPYPKPDLPGGPSHKISVNHYFSRDARRMVEPNLEVVNNTAKQLSSGEKTAIGSKTVPTPGTIHNWDRL